MESIERQNKIKTQGPHEDADYKLIQEAEATAKSQFFAARDSLYAPNGIENRYTTCKENESQAEKDLKDKLQEIDKLLPNREVKYKPGKHAPKYKLNLNNYKHPLWREAAAKLCTESEQANIERAKKLIDDVPADQGNLAQLNRLKMSTESTYQQVKTHTETLEKAYISQQDKRIAKENLIDDQKKSMDVEKQLQNTFWHLVENMPPKERIQFTEDFLAKLENNQPERYFEGKVSRSEQQVHCLKVARHAYRQQWDGVDSAQRIGLFDLHETESKKRSSTFDSISEEVKLTIHELEKTENPDQTLLMELKKQEQDIHDQKNIEERNLSALKLENKLDQQILHLRALRGISPDPDVRYKYAQHRDFLNQIGQHQALRHCTNLSHTLELLLGEICVKSSREWQHQNLVIPRLITQGLSCAAGLNYLWEASNALIGVTGETTAFSQDGKDLTSQPKIPSSAFDQVAKIGSFLWNMPFEDKVEGYLIPTITVVRTLVHLVNIFSSINEGPVATLQEQFLAFAKEHKKIQDHFHTQIKEQLKGNQELLRQVEQKLSELNELMMTSFKKLEQKIKVSGNSIKEKLDLQSRRNEKEIFIKYGIGIKNKQNKIEKPLTHLKPQDALNQIQHHYKILHEKNNNGIENAKISNILDISRKPKLFTGWLGNCLQQHNEAELNSHLPLPPLLIATASSFLNTCKEIHAQHKNDCSPELKKFINRIASDFLKDIERLLSMIAQQDTQLEKAALILEKFKLTAIDKLEKANLLRNQAIINSSKKSIEASEECMQGLVEAPTLFTQRFAITRDIIHLLNNPLPPVADKIKKMLHPERTDISEGTFVAVVGALSLIVIPQVVIPVSILTAPFVLIAGAISYLSSGPKSEFEQEKIHPYAFEGRFGSPMIAERFEKTSLIALAKLLPPAEIQIYRPAPKEGNESISLTIRSVPIEDSLEKPAELKASSLYLKASVFIPGTKSSRAGPATRDIWLKNRQRENYEGSVNSLPLVEAKVIVHFNKELSQQVKFTEQSWVQPKDLKAIEQLWSTREHLDMSLKTGAQIAGTYKAFLEMQKAGVDAELGESPFAEWLGEYQLVPAAQDGIPLVLPKECMEMIDAILRDELIERHLSENPTLIPFYEWKHYEVLDLYSLEIVIKTNGAKATECHRLTLFTLEKDTVEALRGKPDFCGERQGLVDSATLLYVMYCGFWNLGMPTKDSYKLASGKAILSCDAPFEGYYKRLKTIAKSSRQDLQRLQKSLDWECTEKGKKLREKAEKAARTLYREDPLFLEYRRQYFLATSLAKLQNSVENKGSNKEESIDDLAHSAQYESTNLKAMFADNGLPWPETFELSKEVIKDMPQLEMLKKELEFLPFSKTARQLADLYFELQTCSSKFTATII